MPSPTEHDWFLNLDAAAREHSARQSRRPALIASIAIHSVVLALLLGLGLNMRSRASHAPNGLGLDLRKEPAGFGGLQSGLVAWKGGCERIDDSTSMELVRSVQRRVSAIDAPDPGSVVLPLMESALVRAIDADSLCQRAGHTIDEIVRPFAGYRPRRLLLVRAGGVFLAVDTALRKTVPGGVFVLDSTVSRVLSRGRR